VFEGWNDYYLLVASASAALIGLLFVVVTLTPPQDPSQVVRGQQLYMSPIVYHLAMVLTGGAVAMAPRTPDMLALAIIGLIAAVGLATAAWVTWQIGRSAPHWTDRWWYGVGPGAAYLGLIVADLLHSAPLIAAGQLALLLISIRNAWDLVTWLAPRRKAEAPPEGS